MFKCCVCHGKSSRRTSQEEDEEESSREMDEEDEEDEDDKDSSSSDDSDDEKDEDEEEREIEEELAKKFKNPNIPEPTIVRNIVKETLKEEDEEEEEEDEDEDEDDEDDEDDSEEKNKIEKVIVEVNGDIRSSKEESPDKDVDREAVKEDVAEILNNAMQIVQEIRRGEKERLEKIKEEVTEEVVEETKSVTPEIVEEIKSVTEEAVEESKLVTEDVVADVITNGEIQNEIQKKPELEKVESDETEEDVVTVIEDEEGEYEIIEDIKTSGEAELDKSRTNKIEEMIIEELINELNEEADNDQELKEIVETPTGSQLELVQKNNEQELSESRSKESTPINKTPSPKPCEVEIIDNIKKTAIYHTDNIEDACTIDQDIVEVNVQQGVTPVEAEAIEEILLDSINGDLLNIPPPTTPPPEEAILSDYDKQDGSSTEPDFPTPPPIDFDIVETDQEDEGSSQESKSRAPPLPPWDDETDGNAEIMSQVANMLPVLTRQSSKLSSPGSKSLPSPPSPGSETGCETEAESKSSSEERTAKIVPCGSKLAYIERTIDDGPDEEGDDSVFETVSLTKDPEIIKDIPPRPVPPVPRWLSQEEDEQESNGSEGFGGMQEPPATPVARDELALRRHRFFSDLLQAARSTAEHRVSFDPLGPLVHPGCDHDEREEHLEELVNRLESVTKRLEQVSVAVPIAAPVQTQEIAVQTKSPSPERSLSIAEELQNEETSQSSSSSSRESTVSAPSVVEVVKSMSVAGYQDLLDGPVQGYIQLSQKIGGDVATHCKLVDKLFQIQLQFLKTAASRPAPTSQSEQVTLLSSTSKQIQEIQDFREKHRGSPFFNHLSAISESIPALGWVAVSPTPAPYVKEMNDAGQFYTNRVLKDWKEKDKTHVEWCKTWVKTLTDLQQFVRQHHTTGLVWAKTGSVPAGGVPPPPPPCMMPMADPAPVVNNERSALFAEINQGENITKNLKKVTSDMQTHKNASLRTGPAPFKAQVVSNSGSPVKTTLPANAPIDKAPVFTRDGKKWLVEYHKGNKNLLVDNVEMNNVIYMFRCQDSNLVIKGKVNSVVLDSCRKCAVVVDSVVASIEFVNCQSVQMQVLGKIPTISIDKTDGCQMYLNKDTLDVELITSKSSEMNVLVPLGNGDYTEYPVPEQFKTVITQKGLSTSAVDSLG